MKRSSVAFDSKFQRSLGSFCWPHFVYNVIQVPVGHVASLEEETTDASAKKSYVIENFSTKGFHHNFETIKYCSFPFSPKLGGPVLARVSAFCLLMPLLPFISSSLLCSCFPTVKYIKEMSAFFKSSGSPGAGLPWDSPPSTPQRGAEHSPVEVKEPRSIPLKICQVSRKQCPPDTENR